MTYLLNLAFGFIGIPILIALLIYFIPKKIGYPKAAKYLTIAYLLLLFTLVITTVFRDELFTKKEARKLIEEQEIILADEFKLEKVKSTSIFDDFYETFILVISERDKLKIIEQIKKSNDYWGLLDLSINYPFAKVDRYNGPKQIRNYETKDSYVREYFKPNGPGHAPTLRRISISKTENQLLFEDLY